MAARGTCIFFAALPADGCAALPVDADGCAALPDDADGCAALPDDADGCAALPDDALRRLAFSAGVRKYWISDCTSHTGLTH